MILNDVLTFLKFGWPFIILFGIVIAKVKWKPWVIDVVILEKRGKNIVKTNDRAKKYMDKYTKLTGYQLMKSKDTLPVVEYNWILHNENKHTNLLERLVNILRPTLGTLFLFKYGSKQYKPLIVGHDTEAQTQLVASKDANGKTIYVHQYKQFDPRGYLNEVKMEIFDWDNMNFAFQEMRASFERRQKEGQWMKTILMPIAIIAAATMVSIVMLKMALDYSSVLKAGGVLPDPALANQPAETPNIPIIGDAFAPK